MKKQIRNDFKKTKWPKFQKNQNSNRCSLRNANFTYKIGKILRRFTIFNHKFEPQIQSTVC